MFVSLKSPFGTRIKFVGMYVGLFARKFYDICDFLALGSFFLASCSSVEELCEPTSPSPEMTNN